MEKTIQINVMDEKEFFVDEAVAIHGPTKFCIDFKTTTPRGDAGNIRIVARHNVAILDPFLAKDLLRILGESVANYEKKFGVIEKPKALTIAENSVKKEGKKMDKPQSYFG